MKTYQPSSKDIRRKWHLIDAKDETLGRISTKIASLLMGKSKVEWADHLDVGDFVVVINSDKVKVSGNKAKNKSYKSHSGYPGGFKEVSFAKMMAEHPERVISHSVSGMLPDNKLKSKRMARMKVFKGENNPYENRFTDKGEKAKLVAS